MNNRSLFIYVLNHASLIQNRMDQEEARLWKPEHVGQTFGDGTEGLSSVQGIPGDQAVIESKHKASP